MGKLQGILLRLYGKTAGLFKALAVCAAAWLLPAPAQAGPVIAFLGDSLVQGFGLPHGDGLVPRLQEWLKAQGSDATLLNAGVSGDTTAGGLSRIDWTLKDRGDVVVDGVIVALGGNDVLRGLDPSMSRENLDGILSAISSLSLPALLVGMEAPPNYGPEYKRSFDSMFAELARKHGVMHYEGFFAPIAERAGSMEGMLAYLQPDGIHPNAEGVRVIVESFGPEVAKLAALAGR